MSQTPSEDIHQHSGWLIPLGFLILVGVLSGLMMLYYLRPGPHDTVPEGDARTVSLTVAGLKLNIPANYIKSADARRGGDQKALSLVALLPDLTGYSQAEGKLFDTNAPDSPVINILLHGGAALVPADRMARVYRHFLADGTGVAGSFALTRYVFRADSGYARTELFAGQSGGALVLLLCEKPMPDLASPNCIATDRPFAPGVNLSYRFKRAYLSRWATISNNVNMLLEHFEALH